MKIENLTIEEFTTPAPVTVQPQVAVEDAFTLMQRAKVHHLPVESNGEILGIVSDRDLRPFLNRNWSRCITVSDVMSAMPLSVPYSLPIGDAAFLMAKNKIGSLLVNDENGELCGIFTITDALNALVELTMPGARKGLEHDYEEDRN